MSQSEWDSAPFNEVEVPERDFDVTCSQTLSRTVTVTTNNYVPGASGCDYEPDDEGGYATVSWHDAPDTSDTNWADEYAENEHYTPLQLINLFKRYLEDIRDNSGIASKAPSYIKHLIEECEGWQEDETEFIG